MSEYPLISCIMPTSGMRLHFARQAVRYFNAQDYPNKELIVIDGDDEGFQSVYGAIPIQENIEYINVDMSGAETHLTIGAKRNLACSLAKGEIICQWDDDDYYGSSRLSKQVQYLLNHPDSAMTGLRTGAIVDIERWQAWTISDALHTLMFHADVHGGTIMYWKRLWENSAYPNISVGEDAQFMRRVLPLGARIVQVPNDGDFVYIRHGKNAWDIALGEHIESKGWQQVEIEQYIPAKDRAFYQAIAGGAHHGSG